MELAFNLSHAFELVLYAVGRGVSIGVDIEYLRPVNEFWDIARSYFSKREVAMLQTVPPNQQLEAFYNCWTRKEAYIKARGEGLSMPLNQFDVTLIPGDPARLLEIRGSRNEADQWQLESFIPQVGYVAALAWMKTR
ncbi:MAG: 4'-phosphopantetheinyl transferase superfamily protein, partial [Anaerolineae bacterium]|nr:4'-phosphopantetheinyl transferase superfamily protein [Anaerolineae bacterium]